MDRKIKKLALDSIRRWQESPEGGPPMQVRPAALGSATCRPPWSRAVARVDPIQRQEEVGMEHL